MSLMDILMQVASGNVKSPDDHFDQVAQHAPADLMGQGVSEAFHSDQTPPFGEMVGQLFGQSSGSQQAGMLNQILAAVGPMAMAGLAGGALSKMMAPGATQITPDQASRLTPEQIQEIASQAKQQEPGIVDRLGSFYAEHPTLVKTLGGAALAIAMNKMNQSMRSK